jgi:hypothetical protein
MDDELPAVSLDEVEEALLERIKAESTLVPIELDEATLALAKAAASGFRSPG